MKRLSILCCLAIATLWATPAHAEPVAVPQPVEYNFFAGIPHEVANHGGSLPGSNNWNCRPSAQHPEPVVLVHGGGGGPQTNWGLYVPLLVNEGYCVFALHYGSHPELPWPLSVFGGLKPMEDSATELSTYVDRVLAATGAKKVDIVAHSEGTVMGDYYAKFLGGGAKIDKYVALGPAWYGSNQMWAGEIEAYLRKIGPNPVSDVLFHGPCPACAELGKGSDFLQKLDAGGPAVPGVTYTSIMTADDDLVVPYTAGHIDAPNVTNVVVQDGCSLDFSDHLSIAGSPRAAGFALNALDPTHPVTPPCVFVPPFTG